jgi:hypothetical protein
MFDGVELQCRTGQADALGEDLGQQLGILAAFDRHHQDLVGACACGFDAEIGQDAFHLPEVHPQPDDLDEPAAPPHHFVDACRVAFGQVTGAEFVDCAAGAEILRGFGVAQHHVGSGVDELAVLQPGHRVDAECAAGHRDADGAGMLCSQAGREVGHPGSGLGLTVHDEQFPAIPAAEFGVALHPLRGEAASRLRDVPQGGEVHPAKPTRSSRSNV